MNRTYRLIWNDTLGLWQTAPELARARSKRSRGDRQRGRPAAVATGLLISLASAVAGAELPSGESVTYGDAKITRDGNQMIIEQGSERVITEWESFSIAKDAAVNFQQPGADSVALNRVMAGDPSRILGQLTANGHVMLVNPAGIYFGQNSQIDVGALTASTLDITDSEFLAGNYRFEGNGAAIESHGEFEIADGGHLAFIAPSIEHQGSINAPSGAVGMAAGESVQLSLHADGVFDITVERATLDALIDNGGAIRADEGVVILTAEGLDAVTQAAVNNDGVIEAQGLVEDGGEIVLEGGDTGTVRQAGELDVAASSGEGGRIQVTGDSIELREGSTTVATGVSGGGDVLVGGDWQGGANETRRVLEDPDALQEATAVTMDAGARIDASATRDGDGGTVVLWSDEYTGYFGQISAQGGVQGGDGGFVETSSRQTLHAFGSVDASATAGVSGEWLLDPYNVEIIEGDAESLSSGTFEPDADDAQIGADTIVASLDQGTDVTITTAGDGNQAGDITVDALIGKTEGGDATLALDADRNIIVIESITSTSGALSLAFSAETGEIFLDADLHTLGGDARFEAARDIVLSRGVALDTTNADTGDGGHVVFWADRDGDDAGGALFDTNSSVTTNGGHIWVGGGSGTDTFHGIDVGDSDAGQLDTSVYGGVHVLNATLNASNSNGDPDGDLYLSGRSFGDWSGFEGIGVRIHGDGDGAELTAGDITIHGHGAENANNDYNYGVGIEQDSTLKASGDIHIEGQGGGKSAHGTSGTNRGVSTFADGGDEVHIKATGAGHVTLIGTGGGNGDETNNDGLVLQNITVQSDTGDITLKGTQGENAGSSGINAADSAKITSTSGNLVIDALDDSQISSVIETDGSLTKQGDGTLELSGDNTYSGDTTVESGILQAGADSVTEGGDITKGALGTGSITVGDGAALDLNGKTVANALTVQGTGISDGSSDTGVVFSSSGSAASLNGDMTLDGDSLIQTDGDLTLAGSIDEDSNGSASALTLSNSDGGSGSMILAGDIGNARSITSLTANDPVVLGADIGITTTGDVVFGATVDSDEIARDLSVDAADITFGDSLGGDDALAALTVDNSGTATLTGDVTTNESDIQFKGPLVLTEDTALSTLSGAGDIHFASTVDGVEDTSGEEETPETQNLLTLTAGTGDITFDGAVGSTERLDTVLLNAVADVTINHAFDITEFGRNTAGTGTFTLGGSGAIDAHAGSVTIDSDAVALEGDVTTVAGGTDGLVSLTAGSGGVTQGEDSTITTTAETAGTVSGAVTITSGGDLDLAGTLDTQGASNADGNGADGGAVTLEVTDRDDPFRLGGTIDTRGGDATGGNNDGGTPGAITFTTDAISLKDSTITAAGGSGSGTGTASSGSSFTLGKSITLEGTASTVDTGSTGGDITLNTTVTGDAKLSLDAGTGDVVFGQAIGASEDPVNSTLNVKSAKHVDINEELHLASFQQQGGTGLTTFGSNVITDSANGVDVTNASVLLGDGVSIEAAGAGDVKLTADSNAVLTPDDNQNYGIKLEGDIQTADGDILLDGKGRTNNPDPNSDDLGENTHGVWVQDQLSVTGSGDITIEGSGGGTSDTHGVFLDADAKVVGLDADTALSIDGTGGGISGDTDGNQGVLLANNDGLNTNDGVITLTGEKGQGFRSLAVTQDAHYLQDKPTTGAIITGDADDSGLELIALDGNIYLAAENQISRLAGYSNTNIIAGNRNWDDLLTVTNVNGRDGFTRVGDENEMSGNVYVVDQHSIQVDSPIRTLSRTVRLYTNDVTIEADIDTTDSDNDSAGTVDVGSRRALNYRGNDGSFDDTNVQIEGEDPDEAQEIYLSQAEFDRLQTRSATVSTGNAPITIAGTIDLKGDNTPISEVTLTAGKGTDEGIIMDDDLSFGFGDSGTERNSSVTTRLNLNASSANIGTEAEPIRIHGVDELTANYEENAIIWNRLDKDQGGTDNGSPEPGDLKDLTLLHLTMNSPSGSEQVVDIRADGFVDPNGESTEPAGQGPVLGTSDTDNYTLHINDITEEGLDFSFSSRGGITVTKNSSVIGDQTIDPVTGDVDDENIVTEGFDASSQFRITMSHTGAVASPSITLANGKNIQAAKVDLQTVTDRDADTGNEADGDIVLEDDSSIIASDYIRLRGQTNNGNNTQSIELEDSAYLYAVGNQADTGKVDLFADQLTLGTTNGSVTAGEQLTIRPMNNEQHIEVGGTGTGTDKLYLTDAKLERFRTDTLLIGRRAISSSTTSTGGLSNLRSNIDVTGTDTLNLREGSRDDNDSPIANALVLATQFGDITQDQPISVGSLAAFTSTPRTIDGTDFAASITLGNAGNDVDVFAADTRSSDIAFMNLGDFTVDSVPFVTQANSTSVQSIIGVKTSGSSLTNFERPGGDVALTAISGDGENSARLTISQDLSANAGGTSTTTSTSDDLAGSIDLRVTDTDDAVDTGGVIRFASGSSLSVNAIGGDSASQGDITLENAVEMAVPGTLTVSTGSTGGHIEFSDTLKADAEGAATNNLTLTAGSGDVTLADTVGDDADGQLGALKIMSADETLASSDINAISVEQFQGIRTTLEGNVTASSGRLYVKADNIELQGTAYRSESSTTRFNGPTTLADNTTIEGSTVTFDGTLDSADTTARELDIEGNAVFEDAVGAAQTLDALEVFGTTGINGGSVTTDGVQIYKDAITLGETTTLAASRLEADGSINLTNGDQIEPPPEPEYDPYDLTVDVSDTDTASLIEGTISGLGDFTKGGAAELILAANNTYGGTTRIDAGTLQIGDGGSTGTLGEGDVTNNGAVVFDNDNDRTVTNAISGTGSLTKLNTNELTLTGSMTYDDLTKIDDGALIFENDDTPATSEYQGSGSLTIRPDSDDFASDFLLSSLTFQNTLTGLTIGKEASADGENDIDVTVDSSVDITGPVSLFGGTIAIEDTLSTARVTNADIRLVASEDTSVDEGVAVSTDGGDAVFWADRDGDDAGGALFDKGSSVTTDGGHIWVGGGSGTDTFHGTDVGDSDAGQLDTSVYGGVHVRNATLDASNSNGETDGDLYLSGRSFADGTDSGGIGVRLYGDEDGVELMAGDITIHGHGAEANNNEFNYGVGIEQDSTLKASGDIHIEGQGGGQSATADSDRNRGISTFASGDNEVRIEATGAGDITLIGTGGGNPDESTIDNNDGLVLRGVIQSNTGDIILEGSQGKNADSIGIFLEGTLESTAGGHISATGDGDVQIANDISTRANSPTGDVRLKSTDDIAVDEDVTLSTDGGNAVFWADSDGNDHGGVVLDLDSSVQTQGGHIWIGGGAGDTTWNGLTVGDGYAAQLGTTAGDSDDARRGGINIVNASIDAGAGQLYVSGRGFNTGEDTVMGVRLFGEHDSGDRTQLDADHIEIHGVGSANGSSGDRNWGVGIENTDVIATDSVDIDGEGGGSDSSGEDNDGVRLQNTKLEAGDGGTTLEGTAGANESSEALALEDDNIQLGAADQSGGITLIGDEFFVREPTPLETTGAVTITQQSANAPLTSPIGSADLVLGSNVSELMLGRSASPGDLTVGDQITLDGPITLNGDAISLDAAVEATGEALSLNAGGAVTQSASAALTANSLALGGAGAFDLKAAANNVNTLAGGSDADPLGSLSYANASALDIGTVNPTGLITSGEIFVATTSGDLTVSEDVSTDSTSASAIVLAAGAGAAAGGDGNPDAGNIIVSDSPELSAGPGGTIGLYSGSVSDSTGLTDLVGSGSGNFRYDTSIDADGTVAKGYTSTLATEVVNALYREQPTITGDAEFDEDEIVYGDDLPSVTSSDIDGLVNGDDLGLGAEDAQRSSAGKLEVDTYDVAAVDNIALGYASDLTTEQTLEVTPRPLDIVGLTAEDRQYDGSTAVSLTGTEDIEGEKSPEAGEYFGNDDVDLSGSPSAEFDSKNVGNYSPSVDGLSLNGDDASNYSLNDLTVSAEITRQDSVIWTGNGVASEWFDPDNWETHDGKPGAVPDRANVETVVVPEGTGVTFDESQSTGSAEAGDVRIASLTYEETSGSRANGSFDLVDGSLAIEQDASLGAFSSRPNTNLSVGGSLSVETASDQVDTVEGPIDGDGDLTKTGAGTLALEGANTYAGGSTVEGGVLRAGVDSVGGSGSITSGAFGAGVVTVEDGAALDLNGQTVANALSVEGDGFSDSGAVFNGTSDAARLDGAITLENDSLIQTDGDLDLAGPIDATSSGGASALTTGNSSGASGEITLAGDIGGRRPITGLSATESVTLAADIQTTQAQTFAGSVKLEDNVELTSTGGDVAFDQTVDAGAGNGLSVDAASIRFDGDVTTSGVADLSAEGDITLDSRGNALTGTVSLDGGNVSVINGSGLEFGESTVSGDLALTTGTAGTTGGVTQSGAVTVQGASTFTADTVEDQEALLSNARNDFHGGVSFVNANKGSWQDVTVADTDDVSLSDITASGKLTAQAAGDVDLTGDISAGEAELSSTSGSVRQVDGRVEFDGDADLAAGQNVMVDGVQNAFPGSVSISGADVAINTLGDLLFGVTDVAGDADLRAGGRIRETEFFAVNVDGDLEVFSGTSDVQLAILGSGAADESVIANRASEQSANAPESQSDSTQAILAEPEAIETSALEQDDFQPIASGGQSIERDGNSTQVTYETPWAEQSELVQGQIRVHRVQAGADTASTVAALDVEEQNTGLSVQTRADVPSGGVDTPEVSGDVFEVEIASDDGRAVSYQLRLSDGALSIEPVDEAGREVLAADPDSVVAGALASTRTQRDVAPTSVRDVFLF